jgi:hypothetical protein
MGQAVTDFNIFGANQAASGLDLDDVQASAGRQLVASLVVAIVVLAAAALMALCPTHTDLADVSQHRFAAVQQPVFVSQSTQRVAGLVRHEIELP